MLQYFESPEAHARVMEAARLAAKDQNKTMEKQKTAESINEEFDEIRLFRSGIKGSTPIYPTGKDANPEIKQFFHSQYRQLVKEALLECMGSDMDANEVVRQAFRARGLLK